MIDPFGRRITYVRVSVTDRCDLRCSYCMAEHMTFLPKADLLTLEEMDRLCAAFIRRGVRKLRLTGGEPLVRRNVMRLIRSVSRHVAAGDLEELTLTTNGSRLAGFADDLRRCGMRRINVSLDTLDAERFAVITRRGRLSEVMAGIEAAAAAGLRLRINTVALKGMNDDEFNDLVAWCGTRGFDLCFIETMPLGEVNADRVDRYLPLTMVRRRLEQHWTLIDTTHRTGGPARYAHVVETGCRVGFITPLTHNFCESCNRVRVSCTGTLYMCLGQQDAADLRTPLRDSSSDIPLLAAIDEAIARKPKGHDFIIDRSAHRPMIGRHMSVTGG